MGTVTKYGRDFQFDDETPAEVQDRRVQNWMKQNAPDELEVPATPGGPAETSAPKHNQSLALLASSLMQALPGGSLVAGLPGFKERAGDVNAYRTIAQGALPYADEATAAVRSLFGTPYDTALAEERQGPKDYGQKYGEGEKTLLELLGAMGTVPLTMGAGAALQGARAAPMMTRVGQAMLKHPWLSGAATGAGSGAIAGFGAGEGDFANRMGEAGRNTVMGGVLGPLAYAGVKGIEKGANWLKSDNAVANYLRKRISTERSIDPTNPDFTRDAMRDLRKDVNKGQQLSTDPMLADTLPGTAEAVMQMQGKDTNKLGNRILKRQYDPDLPENLARDTSQHGRVENVFDLAFGPDVFKHSDDALMATRRADADRMFTPAYQHNIDSPEIGDALDRIHALSPDIWKKAHTWAQAERRPVGAIDATGNLRSYNTQFLHDIKRSMDEALGAEKMANPRFNDVPYLNAKRDLNAAMKEANPEYKAAMEKYGEHSDMLNALQKGREDVFKPGSVDLNGAMDANAIRAHLNDQNIPDAQKDLFRVGAARALREKVLASQSKKYTHNWADLVTNPEYEKRIGALLDDKTLGAWDLFRSQMNRENTNYKNLMGKALGNSRTNARQELVKELEGDMNPGSMVAAALHPTSAGVWQRAGTTFDRYLNRGTVRANKTATLLGGKGTKENRDALSQVEDLLKLHDTRRDMYGRVGAGAPAVAGYAYPWRADNEQ